MGAIIYNTDRFTMANTSVALADALTQHVLRRGLAFTLVITGTGDDGNRLARSLWMSPNIPVQFLYEDFETVEVSRELVRPFIEDALINGIVEIGDTGMPYEFVDDESDDDAEGE